jgi:hypothetical protein
MNFFPITLTALLLCGCAITPRKPVPKQVANTAHVPGLGEGRIMIEIGDTNMPGQLAKFLSGFDVSGGTNNHVHVLALSGGGENGAFGAGLLCGWTQAGTRPQFDMVTGISTGSLIAPLAFLGSGLDPQLRHGYTEIQPSQVFLKRGFFGILKHRDAVADSKPLQRLIKEILGEKEFVAIAAEHRKGRRLLVMTTNLDSQKPVIWDIGAIACSGYPDSLNLIRKILLASSSIPVVFPPVLFDVEADGRHYDELHVDGGVTAQVFGAGMLLFGLPQHKAGTQIDFYLIRNGRIGPEYAAPERKISAIAGRSIETLMKVQGANDVLRLWTFSRASGANFHYVTMPDEFQLELKNPFDLAYMKALFDFGYRQGISGIAWHEAPPAFSDIDLPQPAQAR